MHLTNKLIVNTNLTISLLKGYLFKNRRIISNNIVKDGNAKNTLQGLSRWVFYFVADLGGLGEATVNIAPMVVDFHSCQSFVEIILNNVSRGRFF